MSSCVCKTTYMESISIFDIFKIGVGPSSSHTLGPWKAALDFLHHIDELEVDHIVVQLFGSLSKTGRGHATDVAVQLGLEGYDPVTVDPNAFESILNRIVAEQTLIVNGKIVEFSPSRDIVFLDANHVKHPNVLIIKAFNQEMLIKQETYASVGGGFIEREIEELDAAAAAVFVKLPYPIQSGDDLRKACDKIKGEISDVVILNELYFGGAEEIHAKIDELLETMLECVYRGCMTGGMLPGGLNVKRRAKDLCYQLTGEAEYTSRDEWIEAIENSNRDFNTVNKWISCFALAVNEENAALSRVVTSPTNGAAGVIPAVLLYYYFFCDYGGKDTARRFMLTAGEIGCLFKKGATISAAVGGCQAEIGVSSSMAAAALTEVLGGSPEQAMMAAEIAMEHHLGLTCDPIGGLVQIPCIERNAMGAMKAITAANLAISSDPSSAIVNLDTVIKTMWDTAQDMNGKYKETSEGGLAFNLPVVMANC